MTISLAKVIGTNARALRLNANVTAERFAAAAASMGLPWSTGRVGDFEHGRIAAPDLPTIYAAAAALGEVIGRPVTLPELLATTSPVVVNDSLTIKPAALFGEVVPIRRGPFRGKGTLASSAAPVLETDHRACRSVGVDSTKGIAAMVRRWGHPLSAERDLRAPAPEANAQRRGIVTRQLLKELREELES
jgi:transcriptional regulator with XRE-family HTH domain